MVPSSIVLVLTWTSVCRATHLQTTGGCEAGRANGRPDALGHQQFFGLASGRQ